MAVLALTAGVLAPLVDADVRRAQATRAAAHAKALARSEHRALLSLYAAESALAGAQAELWRTESRAAALGRAESSARRQAAILERSLASSHRRVAATLRTLYIEGEADPIAVVFGAASLDAVLTGIEGLQRASAQNRRLVREVAERGRQLVRFQARLSGQRAVLDAARAEAGQAARRLAKAVGARRSTVDSIRRQGVVARRRLAVLQSEARAAQRRSARISERRARPVTTLASETVMAGDAGPALAVPAPPRSPPTTILTGTRELVVDAVAYHLPGRTASGLPVGHGIVAVDPAVIPLGTRMLVPGYGAAVAADVGSAVRGNIIDLWMPSRAAALRWGRRTVTITLYG